MPTPTYLSINEFPGDGVTTQFEFSFAGGYIDETHVKAYIKDADGLVTPVSLNGTMFVTPSTLNLGVAAPVGGLVRIYRKTPRNAPLVDYTTGARLSERNLDLSARQAILSVAESFDNAGFTGATEMLEAAGEALRAALDAEAIFLSPGIQSLVNNRDALYDLAADLTSILSVHSNSTNINLVAGNINAILDVSLALSDVYTVAADISSVITVASNIANINIAAANVPALAAKVNKAGDTLTGHLNTVAGASGDQVPRASEVGALAVTQRAVGVVSQSGGLPTGAIVESGNNANGSYIRYADGTQICRNTMATSASGGVPWTFPKAFSAAPNVNLTPAAAVAQCSGIVGVSTVLCTVATWGATTGSLVTSSLHCVAVGRWF